MKISSHLYIVFPLTFIVMGDEKKRNKTYRAVCKLFNSRIARSVFSEKLHAVLIIFAASISISLAVRFSVQKYTRIRESKALSKLETF